MTPEIQTLNIGELSGSQRRHCSADAGGRSKDRTSYESYQSAYYRCGWQFCKEPSKDEIVGAGVEEAEHSIRSTAKLEQ